MRRGTGARAGLSPAHREARGDLPMLVVLAVLVAALTALSACAPPLIGRQQDRALRQRIAAAQTQGPLLTVGTRLQGLNTALGPANSHEPIGAVLSEVGDQLVGAAAAPLRGSLAVARTGADFAPVRTSVPSTPATAGVDSVVTGLTYLSDAGPHVRMVAGAFPAAHTAKRQDPQLALSHDAAARLGLSAGGRIGVSFSTGNGEASMDFTVSGIFEPRQTGDGFWNSRPLLDTPLTYPQPPPLGIQVYVHALISTDGVDRLMAAGLDTPQLSWQLSVAPARAAVAQSRSLAGPLAGYGAAMTAVLCQGPGGTVGCQADQEAADRFSWTDGLTPLLVAFGRERLQAEAVQSFALVALVCVVLAAAFTAVRVLLRRRDGALRLQRSRGASPLRLVLLRSAPALPVLLCAAGAGWLLGLRSAPTGGSVGPRPLWAVAATAAVWALLPLLTWVQTREPRRPRRSVRAVRHRFGGRAVLEATALLLAAAGVVALRGRGASAPQGVDPQLSAVPLVVAVVAVLALLRIYPLVLRLLAARLRRGPGVLAFLGLAKAGREATATGLALFVLVLTLGTAVFGGMVSRTVSDGAAAGAGWYAGADAVALSSGNSAPVPGVARGVKVVGEQLRAVGLTADRDGAALPDTPLLTVDARALVAADPGSPLGRALLAASAAPVRRADGSVELPVLVSPAVLAAEPAGDFVSEPFSNADHLHRVRYRPVGTLTAAELDDPALGPITDQLAPGSRLLVTGSAAAPALLQPQVAGRSAALLYGDGDDPAALRTEGAAVLGPLGTVRLRSDRLAAVRADGLVGGIQRVYAVSTGLAVCFGLLAVLLELVLTAEERGRTASFLRTLGLGGRAAGLLQLTQLLPLAAAAAAGGAILGLVEPRLLAPALNLRQFTGGPGQPALHTDYRLTGALVLGLVLLVVAAAAVETAVSRYRRLGELLRLGDA
ncbi:hypothetical protein ABUW04_19210 [Streptacidiphilus sp. N1-10]|uniref:ABC transport system permease protein n=1 Tax=Streptacidiphilus jeojiensis TaxID=3229225 RepID=A0ABV6XQF3_9ACTN